MRNTMTGRLTLALMGSVAAVAIVGGASLIDGSMIPAPAQAQARTSVSDAVLDRHGRWERHPRWGEVWLPVNRPRDWRPYTHGIGRTPMSGAGIGFRPWTRRIGAGSRSGPRLRTTPEKNPRTECRCQPVMVMIAWMVAPSGRRSRAMTCACLEPTQAWEA